MSDGLLVIGYFQMQVNVGVEKTRIFSIRHRVVAAAHTRNTRAVLRHYCQREESVEEKTSTSKNYYLLLYDIAAITWANYIIIIVDNRTANNVKNEMIRYDTTRRDWGNKYKTRRAHMHTRTKITCRQIDYY